MSFIFCSLTLWPLIIPIFHYSLYYCDLSPIYFFRIIDELQLFNYNYNCGFVHRENVSRNVDTIYTACVIISRYRLINEHVLVFSLYYYVFGGSSAYNIVFGARGLISHTIGFDITRARCNERLMRRPSVMAVYVYVYVYLGRFSVALFSVFHKGVCRISNFNYTSTVYIIPVYELVYTCTYLSVYVEMGVGQ